MKNKLLSLVIGSSLVLGAYANTNITIQDYKTGGGFSSTNGIGVGNEDQETEPGTVQTQAWDMEAFAVNGSTLYIVTGYNMSTGESNLMPGDLFIKVGGSKPGFLPNAANSGPTMTNALDLYSHVVDLTKPNNQGVTTGLATVYGLNSSSVFDTVIYDQFNSNPWRYNSGGSVVASSAVTYYTGLSNAAASAYAGSTVTGGLHNVLAVDLSFLSVPAGTDVWFSYTMECGNDSLKGDNSDGFYKIPDAFSSALLISFGLSALAFFGLKRRRS